MQRLTLEPVGIIRSEHRDHARTPIQPACAQGCRGRVEVFPQFAEALDDVEGFSHLHLIFWLHRAGEIANSVAGPSPLKSSPIWTTCPEASSRLGLPCAPIPSA